ncbi:hypothetical protein Taro_002230, partial [Colocasia esculenta]|nr:hypothetical protein [Colocasia esculenta]
HNLMEMLESTTFRLHLPLERLLFLILGGRLKQSSRTRLLVIHLLSTGINSVPSSRSLEVLSKLSLCASVNRCLVAVDRGLMAVDRYIFFISEQMYVFFIIVPAKISTFSLDSRHNLMEMLESTTFRLHLPLERLLFLILGGRLKQSSRTRLLVRTL